MLKILSILTLYSDPYRERLEIEFGDPTTGTSDKVRKEGYARKDGEGWGLLPNSQSKNLIPIDVDRIVAIRKAKGKRYLYRNPKLNYKAM